MTETPPLVSVTVPGHGATLNDRLHPMARHRRNRAIKDSVLWALKAQGVRPLHLQRARLRATLGYKTRQHKDETGGWESIKAAVDALIDAGVLVDDSPRHVEWLPLVQVTTGQRTTTLEVWAVDEEG